ncbi:macrophage-capping protein [Rhinatrema bivittatum]|uniref:macrophage-capping protein n=1 Tax=Rhinatrema bivittatum TaxID=194408 RepID=UPI001129846A|nr:macrophage-capping protein [Rhinatrema bivittatum]XP_029430578.1 macrophage-capping protein [Rhinatrema bivittatum]
MSGTDCKTGPQFDPCVQKPGLHIFRVEKMKLVPFPKEQTGCFFSGDSYLLLYNAADGKSNLHMWYGKDTSVDEQGACAMFATQMDTFLGGRPVQYREAQGHESEKFMSYFPKGIKYQEGGVASGLRKVHSDAAQDPKLYLVKGKKNIRASEVKVSWDSFNKGDCFILDLGAKIITWSGSQSNIHERNKANDLANQIREGERKGKATVEIVQEGEEPSEMIEKLGPKPALKDGNPEDDKVADVKHSQAAVLYKVSDASGKMNLIKVSETSPFTKDLLASDDCFVLDNAKNGQLFVWKGHKANSEERKAAMKVANEVIARMQYCSKTQVQIVSDGNESGLFKQFFKAWA